MKRALVLTGGGVKGAFQVGALYHLLYDLEQEFDIITGLSVGALNGSFLAQYNKNELKQAISDLMDLWETINNDSIRKSWKPFGFVHYLWKKSLYDSSPLEDLVDECLDYEKLRTSDIVLNVSTQAVGSGIYRNFCGQDPEIKDAVKASAAFPVFLKSVKINGDLYVDGGVGEIAPLRHAIGLGATHITIINTGPLDSIKINPHDISFLELPMRTIELQGDAIVKDDLREFVETNELLRTGKLIDTSKRVIEYDYIGPEKQLVKNPLVFDPTKISAMIELGYDAAQKMMAKKNG
jgi:NTE family protein